MSPSRVAYAIQPDDLAILRSRRRRGDHRPPHGLRLSLGNLVPGPDDGPEACSQGGHAADAILTQHRRTALSWPTWHKDEVTKSPTEHAAALRKDAQAPCAKAQWRTCLDELRRADEATPMARTTRRCESCARRRSTGSARRGRRPDSRERGDTLSSPGRDPLCRPEGEADRARPRD